MSEEQQPKVVKKWVIGKLQPVEVKLDSTNDQTDNKPNGSTGTRRASYTATIATSTVVNSENNTTKPTPYASPRRLSMPIDVTAAKAGIESGPPIDEADNEEKKKKKKKKKDKEGADDEERNDEKKKKKKKKKDKGDKNDADEDSIEGDEKEKKKKKKKKKEDGAEGDEKKKKKKSKDEKEAGDEKDDEAAIAPEENVAKRSSVKVAISTTDASSQVVNVEKTDEQRKEQQSVKFVTDAPSSTNEAASSSVEKSAGTDDSRFKSYENPAIVRRKSFNREPSNRQVSNAVVRANRFLENAKDDKKTPEAPVKSTTPAWIARLREQREANTMAVTEALVPVSKPYVPPAPTNTSIWSSPPPPKINPFVVPEPPPKPVSTITPTSPPVKRVASSSSPTARSVTTPSPTKKSIPEKQPVRAAPVREDSDSSIGSDKSKNEAKKALTETNFVMLQRKLDNLAHKDRDVIDRCNEIQKKLHTIEFEKNEQLESIKVEYEKKKQALDKEAMARYLEQLDMKDKNTGVLEANQLEVTKIRNENAKLRTNIKDLYQSIAELKVNNERLSESKTASENYVNQLTNHIEKCNEDNTKLKSAVEQYEAAIELVEERYNEINNYYLVECTVKAIYTQLVSSILSLIDKSITDENKNNEYLLLELYEIAEPILNPEKTE